MASVSAVDRARQITAVRKHPVLVVAVWLVLRLLGLVKLTWGMLRLGLRHPAAGFAVVMSLVVLIRVSAHAALIVLTVLTAGNTLYQVWKLGLRWGSSPFSWPILSGLSSFTLDSIKVAYRWSLLWLRWDAGARVLGLVCDDDSTPKLGPVVWHSPNRVSTRVKVTGTGQGPIKLTEFDMDPVASELGAQSVTCERVRDKAGQVDLTVYYGSRLDTPIPLEELPPPQPGWAMFGIGEDDRPAGIRLDTSCLFVGESRSGKSTAVWGACLSVLEQSRMEGGWPVQFWVIDQSQTEFAELEPLAARYVRTKGEGKGESAAQYALDQTQAGALLNALIAEKDRRAAWMRDNKVRKLRPSEEMPWIILVIDELLMLVSRKLSAKEGQKAERNLFMVLTQCAKYGIITWCNTQASKIQVVGDNRDFYPQRVVLSTGSRNMTDCGLGEGANAAGAACHALQLPDDAGIGWKKDSHRGSTYFKFRAVMVEDDDLDAIGRGQLPARLLAVRSAQARARSWRFWARPERVLLPGETEPGAVYRFWSWPDENGDEELLYVGKTKSPNPRTRWWKHFAGVKMKDWADLVARVEVLRLESHAAAVAFEESEIKRCRPRFNKQHNGGRGEDYLPDLDDDDVVVNLPAVMTVTRLDDPDEVDDAVLAAEG